MACTPRTIKQFNNNSFSRFHRTYSYTTHFENHESSIYIKSNNQFLCYRTRYIRTKGNGSCGIEESICSSKTLLKIRRGNGFCEIEESIGSGYIVIEKGQLILRNNDCKIEPPFEELRCYIALSSGIFEMGTETTIRCKNEKGIEYGFWDWEK